MTPQTPLRATAAIPRRHPGRTALVAVLATALVATLGACASVPPPTEQLAVSTAAVAHAVAANGSDPAPAELALARDKLRRANLALAAKDHADARRLADEAQVDALVAEARVESAKAGRAANEVRAASRALREEMGRKAP